MIPIQQDLLGGQSLVDIAVNALRSASDSGPDLPDIVTFAEHPEFLGKRLYPRQKSLLRLIFLETENMTAYDLEVINEWAEQFDEGSYCNGISPDIWERVTWLKENGYPHFREVENVTGRRGAKGLIGAIIGAFQNWRMIKLDDPQWYYGIDRGKDIYNYITATTLDQAKQYQFADFANAVINAPCFGPYISEAKESFVHLRTPADIRRLAEMEVRGIKFDREVASIRNHALSSNSAAGRGGAAFNVIFDEFAHMLVGTAGPRTADKVYEAIVPSLDQMGKDALIYIPTSPYTKVGKAYEVYNDGLMQDDQGRPLNPEILIIQLSSWEIYKDWDNKIYAIHDFRGAPQQYDDQAKSQEKRDPETFKVEKRAQWAEVISAYLRPHVVDRLFEPLELDGKVYKAEPNTRAILRFHYEGHADPAKSKDRFAAMIAHLEPIPDEDGEVWQHVFVDWMQVWDPMDSPDGEIPYSDVEKELTEVITKFGKVSKFTYDQYGSFVTIPRLKGELRKNKIKTTVKEETFTAPANKKRAKNFKSALGMNWVHAFPDTFGPEDTCLLQQELKFLQDKNGKVDHQTIGPVQTKDLADCLMVLVDRMIGDQVQAWKKREELGSMQISAGPTNNFGALHHGGNERRGSDARSRLQSGTRDRLKRTGYSRIR